MLANIYYLSTEPHRVIYVSESNKFNSIEYYPGIEKRTKFLRPEEKTIVENAFRWIVDPIAGIKQSTDQLLPEEHLLLTDARIKAQALEKLWIYFNFSKKNLFDSIMISETRFELIKWEIDNNILDQTSLINFLSVNENINLDQFIEIESIKKETYFKKLRELYISCVEISKSIISSDDPISVSKIEFSRLMGK